LKLDNYKNYQPQDITKQQLNKQVLAQLLSSAFLFLAKKKVFHHFSKFFAFFLKVQ